MPQACDRHGITLPLARVATRCRGHRLLQAAGPAEFRYSWRRVRKTLLRIGRRSTGRARQRRRGAWEGKRLGQGGAPSHRRVGNPVRRQRGGQGHRQRDGRRAGYRRLHGQHRPQDGRGRGAWDPQHGPLRYDGRPTEQTRRRHPASAAAGGTRHGRPRELRGILPPRRKGLGRDRPRKLAGQGSRERNPRYIASGSRPDRGTAAGSLLANLAGGRGQVGLNCGAAGRIIGVGRALGGRVVTNSDLEDVLDTSDEWISTRTGIKSRHFVAEGENAATLAVEASKKALEHAGVEGTSVDLIVCGTSTAPESMPSVACLVGKEIGAPGSGAMDLAAACAGFSYAASVASSLLLSGAAGRVLLIGSDAMSTIVDPGDRY